MTEDSLRALREEFEQAAIASGFRNFTRDGDTYSVETLDWFWIGWQAARAAQAAEIARLIEECGKAERLWKQEAIRAERAETTMGGLENAGRILLARAERAEAALAEARGLMGHAADWLRGFSDEPDAQMLVAAIDAARAGEGK